MLTTKNKKIEFCRWLLSDIEGISLEEKRQYLLYLLEHHLIDNKEVELEMKDNFFGPPDYNWIFDYFNERPEEERARFRQLFYENMLQASTPEEVAQKAFGVNTPEEVAQKVLGANSPQEAAQKLLQLRLPLE